MIKVLSNQLLAKALVLVLFSMASAEAKSSSLTDLEPGQLGAFFRGTADSYQLNGPEACGHISVQNNGTAPSFIVMGKVVSKIRVSAEEYFDGDALFETVKVPPARVRFLPLKADGDDAEVMEIHVSEPFMPRGAYEVWSFEKDPQSGLISRVHYKTWTENQGYRRLLLGHARSKIYEIECTR